MSVKISKGKNQSSGSTVDLKSRKLVIGDAMALHATTATTSSLEIGRRTEYGVIYSKICQKIS